MPKEETTNMTLKRYEVRLYNARVRDLLESGEDNNTGLSDEWADAYYEEVVAPDEEEAKRMVKSSYPASQGFVITEVTEQEEHY